MGGRRMKEKKKKLKIWKIIIQGLPIAAAAGSALLPVQRFGQQFTMLIVLLWIQLFFIVECFMISK
jgi:hypothetical protein